MNIKKLILWTAGAVFVLGLAGVSYVLRPSAEASSPVTAVPLVLESEITPLPDARPTATPGGPTSVPESPAEAGGEPAVAGAPGLTAPSAGAVIYVISQAESEARFSIDEILNNAPVTAVGVTDQIAGEIAIDFDNPGGSLVGVITINARTLTTDRSSRNRMIRNEILDTEEYEFIVFTPTAITGLPAEIVIGESVAFQVTGDLTIRDVSLPVTFEITATVDADGRLSGYAIATVLRSDYGITIPSVPSVAEVSDEVLVEFDFVAYPKE